MRIDPALAAKFRSFTFILRFNKQRIVAVPHEEQLRRSREFLVRLGEIHPLLGNWFLKGNSLKSALKYNVIDNPDLLMKEVRENSDPQAPKHLSYSLWNGEPDPFKGAMTFNYSAHDAHSLSWMRFEDLGFFVLAIPHEVRAVVTRIIETAIEFWPEIDWAVAAPQNYFLYGKEFQDRQTIGWIGYCPYDLQSDEFPDVHELRTLAGRGTLVVTCEDIMDDKNASHVERASKVDLKLAERNLLPLYNN